MTLEFSEIGFSPDFVEYIAMLADYGIQAVPIRGRAGVWIEEDGRGPARKIAAIGIRVHEGVTMHGAAVNCNNDLAPYAQIIARGITDAGVTTMSLETGQDLNPAGIADRFLDEFRKHQDALVATPEGALL